jgi:hypothetical protein
VQQKLDLLEEVFEKVYLEGKVRRCFLLKVGWEFLVRLNLGLKAWVREELCVLNTSFILSLCLKNLALKRIDSTKSE